MWNFRRHFSVGYTCVCVGVAGKTASLNFIRTLPGGNKQTGICIKQMVSGAIRVETQQSTKPTYRWNFSGYKLGQNKWKIWAPPPPISMMKKKKRVSVCARTHHWNGGRGGLFLILFCPRFNLGQNKWKIWAPPLSPSPHFNDKKKVRFGLRAELIIEMGGGGGLFLILFCPRS